MTRIFPYLLCAASIGLTGAWLSGCLADPWPEPDPEQPDGNDDTDTGPGGGDADNDTDTDEDTGGVVNPALDDRVFASAPSPEGVVTVVGLPGAVDRGDSVTIRNASSQETVVSLSADGDGSFAGRIAAHTGESLEVIVSAGADKSAALGIPIGAIENGEWADGAIFGVGSVQLPDDEGQVAIHGAGELLESGDRVIGGNIDGSSGRETLVSCASGCRFDLFIPAERGDEIDVFLVWGNTQSGHTDADTVTVP